MKVLIIAVFLFQFILAGFGQQNDRMAKEYFQRGTDKVMREDYSGAIKDFSVAIRINPYFLQAYENRGVAKYYLNDLSGAIDDYSKALEINPNDYNTFGRRGWAKFYLKDYESAIYDFGKALEGGKNNSKYYLIRGEAKYLIRDFNGALSDFDFAVNSMNLNKIQKSRAYYWRGMIKIDIGEKEAGCLDLKEAKKLGSEEAELLIQAYCR